MSRHKFDVLDWCEDCGAARFDVVNGNAPAKCQGPSVVSIERARSWRFFNNMFGGVMERFE